MQVEITEKCQGHARCWTQAPHLFVLNDEGYLDPAVVDVPPGDELLAKRAVLSCPERALRMID